MCPAQIPQRFGLSALWQRATRPYLSSPGEAQEGFQVATVASCRAVMEAHSDGSCIRTCLQSVPMLLSPERKAPAQAAFGHGDDLVEHQSTSSTEAILRRWFHQYAKHRGLNRLPCQQTNRDRRGFGAAVVLNNHRRTRPTRQNQGHQRWSRSHRASRAELIIGPLNHRIDEGLDFALLGALRHQEPLPPCLSRELGSMKVRNSCPHNSGPC